MNVKAVYHGTKPVHRIYHNGQIIYQRIPDEPDTPDEPVGEWIYPVQNGNVLTIEQVYGAVQNGNVLTLE